MCHQLAEEISSIPPPEEQHRGSDHGGKKDLRFIKSGVYHRRQDPRYRLYKGAPETVHCMVHRYKNLGRYTLKRIQELYYVWIRSPDGWSLKIVENKQDKTLWDLKMRTDRRLLVNLSDTRLVDKEQKMAVAIDVAIRADSEIRQKEQKKTDKYQQLATRTDVDRVLIEANPRPLSRWVQSWDQLRYRLQVSAEEPSLKRASVPANQWDFFFFKEKWKAKKKQPKQICLNSCQKTKKQKY